MILSSSVFLQPSLYLSGLVTSIPILLAALGALLCARAGVFNIAMEGQMLFGAFAAVAGSWFVGGSGVGTLVAIALGALVGAATGLLVVRLRADVIVVGIGINLVAAGLTAFALNVFFHVQGVFANRRLRGLPNIGGETPIFYLALLAVPVIALLLFRTPWGLRLRGVGETPEAAGTLGVSVSRIQIGVITLTGALCGLAGAQLALGQVQEFSENMTAGRGYVALVAVLLARANPWAVAAAAIGFGLIDAISTQLQSVGIPAQLVGIIPYGVALVSLVLFRTRRVPGLSEVGS